MFKEKPFIAVVGLGYVGLPLACEFSRKYSVIGYDVNDKRINELNEFNDHTNEVKSESLHELITKGNLTFVDEINKIKSCNVYIITVPTPIDEFKTPNLKPLFSATSSIGKILKKGDVVIFESTVYPGCTEEECVPILERVSNLKYNKDFFCGYSPERINPGDKINTLTKIKKVTSGSSKDASDYIDKLYSSIICAGTYKAQSIIVAEASKAIENAQRDVNISFVNELALIFDKMGIDTNQVLEAASSKWNFLNFKPGLVGGHCIGVDPYYLVHKSESLGYSPQVILSGRRVNDNMGIFISNKLVKKLIQKGVKLKNSRILILGITFKENCPDTRNSKVVDIYNELIDFGLIVDVHDPLANPEQVLCDFNIALTNNLNKYEAIILAVPHNTFKKLDFDKMKIDENSIIFDVKGVLGEENSNLRL